ncbi:MAG: hypothetical protein WDN06_23170 [Asticcacaulis sp.]
MSQPPFSDMFATIVAATPYMRAIGAVYDGKGKDGCLGGGGKGHQYGSQQGQWQDGGFHRAALPLG